MGIGHKLPISGEQHDVRACDYDDWSKETPLGRGINGDILVWDYTRNTHLELSSMGIRVDAKSLKYQMKVADLQERKELDFHKGILKNKLPLTIGGGIG